MLIDKIIVFQNLFNDKALNLAVEGENNQLTIALSDIAVENNISSPVLLHYAVDRILHLESAFAKSAVVKDELDPSLLEVASDELAKIFQVLKSYEEPSWLGLLGTEEKPLFQCDYADRIMECVLDNDYKQVAKILFDFYHNVGYGYTSNFGALRYEGELVGVIDNDPIDLNSLAGYEYQKEAIIKNTETFLFHNKGNNILLYGEKGTGKSSMVKAVANQYVNEGLCLIEFPVQYVDDLPKVIDELKKQPRHFIFFMDDLTFESGDKDYLKVKAVLEGGIRKMPKNILIYATSNRKNLINERYSNAKDEDYNETTQEKLSLADRFGLNIVFHSPQQPEYLAIVDKLAELEGITMDKEELHEQAIRWSMAQNTRSGRTAKQFIASLTK